MGIDQKLAKLSLPLELALFPGETLEFAAKTGAIKLFEATTDGAFTECCVKSGDYLNLGNVSNESSVIITNYRICYQPISDLPTTPSSSPLFSPLGFTTLVQIPHLTICQIDHSPIQITVSLKFSPSKYLIKFSKPKQTTVVCAHINARTTAISLCEEFADILKRVVYPSSVENMFAFKMGAAILRNKVTEIKEKEIVIKKSHKLTLEEEILDELFGGFSSDEEDENEVETKGIDESVYRRAQILGWTKGYRIQKEFERMQMNQDSWCIASVNDDFSLSPTYPQDFILPSNILKTASSSQAETQQNPSHHTSVYFQNLARFRSRGRFPIICWKKGHHVLMRSGQPMVGFLGSRGLEDELLMREVLRAVNLEQNNHSLKFKSQTSGVYGKEHITRNNSVPKMTGSTKSAMKICMLDARGYASAFSNGYAGGGYEKIENYPPNTSLRFLGLSNIHAISSSHESLLRAISANSTSPNWYSVLESTGWLSHVADLLKVAGGRDGVVGKMVDENASVLVHCTDGWDRTTQLVSLAQIMMDPFYRTIKGLQVLIEKEWIAYGHPFRARGDLPTTLCNSDSRKYNTGKQISTVYSPQQLPNLQTTPAPVFFLFLTCVHHLLQQFPAAFEYNDFLLLCLARAAAGNSPYGDFLCNSENERNCLRLRERTLSIWAWVRERKQWFRNMRYQKPYKSNNGYDDDISWKKSVLRPDTDARLITLWTEYYFPKDDWSIVLLSTPSGAEVSLPNDVGVLPPQHLHTYQVGGPQSEYYLVSLFVKRRRRRIAERVWRTWRALVFERKRKRKTDEQLCSKEKEDILDTADTSTQEDKDDKWVEEMIVGPEDYIIEEGDDNDSYGQHDLGEKDESNSHVLLVFKAALEQKPTLQRGESTDPPPIFLDHKSSSSKEKYERLRTQLQDEKTIATRELCESNLIEWVHLPQGAGSPIMSNVDHNIVDLLKEAQLENDPLLGGKYCHDQNMTIEDLLKEAQDDSPIINGKFQKNGQSNRATICVGNHDTRCKPDDVCNSFDTVYATNVITNSCATPCSSATKIRTFVDVGEFAATLDLNSSVGKDSGTGVENTSSRSSINDINEFVFV